MVRPHAALRFPAGDAERTSVLPEAVRDPAGQGQQQRGPARTGRDAGTWGANQSRRPSGSWHRQARSWTGRLAATADSVQPGKGLLRAGGRPGKAQPD